MVPRPRAVYLLNHLAISSAWCRFKCSVFQYIWFWLTVWCYQKTMKHHTVVKVLLISGTSKKKGIDSSSFYLSKMLIRNYAEGKMNICSMQVVDYFIYFSSTPRNRKTKKVIYRAIPHLLKKFHNVSSSNQAATIVCVFVL